MDHLNTWITETIERLVRENDCSCGYRQPIVGFTTADDPGFAALRSGISPTHFLPEELLPGAKSVVSFFIPVSEETLRSNIGTPSIEYAHVKWMQKGLMESVIEGLRTELLREGIRCSSNTEQLPFTLDPPYHRWLQKPIAVMCGVGKFGVNRQIITKSGCAGRLGSVVIDAEAVPTGRIQEEYCLYLIDGSCGECVKNCPVGALTYDDIDRPKCKQQIHIIQETDHGDLKLSDNCAQCVATCCALERPKPQQSSAEPPKGLGQLSV